VCLQASVTHVENSTKNSIQLDWIAPLPGQTPPVTFWWVPPFMYTTVTF